MGIFPSGLSLWTKQWSSGALRGAIGAAAFHLVLLATLLAAGLIEYDGHRLPMRVVWPALAIGGLVPLVWPQVRPVPAVAPLPGALGQAGAGLGMWSGVWTGAVDGLVGLGLGLAIGLAAWRLAGRRDHLGWVVGPACVGLFLGWQACAAISLAVALLHGILHWAKQHGLGAANSGFGQRFAGLAFWLAGLGWIIAWERLWGLFRLVDRV